MKSYWRTRCRPIIAEVLQETQGKSEKEIRKALTDAYPFGAREHHPYKIWCDEIKIQRGKRRFGTGPHRPEDKNQQNLF